MREVFDFLEQRHGPAFVRRLKRNLLVTVPGMPLLNLLLSPLGYHALWLQVPVAIAYSFLTARHRFTGFVSGLTFLGAELVLLFLADRTVTLGGAGLAALANFTYLIGLVVFFAAGVGIGVMESSSIEDGY